MDSLNVDLLKNKICPANLISFFDRVERLVGRGNATDKMCLDFRKTFDRVSVMSLWERWRYVSSVIVKLGGSIASWWWFGKGTQEGVVRALFFDPTISTSWCEVWMISIERKIWKWEQIRIWSLKSSFQWNMHHAFIVWGRPPFLLEDSCWLWALSDYQCDVASVWNKVIFSCF